MKSFSCSTTDQRVVISFSKIVNLATKRQCCLCYKFYLISCFSENVELTLTEETYELPDLPVPQESNGIMVVESKEMFAVDDCINQLSTEIKNSLLSCHVLENQDSIDEQSSTDAKNSLLPCHIVDDQDSIDEQSSKETKNSLSPCHILKDQDNIDEQPFVTEGGDLLSPVSVDEQIPIEDGENLFYMGL